ncbi:class I SAM-dependent methyltransferase [Sporosarcina pasteurii]|uniref:Ribosomal RNA large subunit methyltransferase G n=1 Tax=Sporosarcina pasteurii TaxID=1474 RepID=A0A380CKU4_SPOPA|nr:class I SAM-dependent methyltransferase [Sporosarcina pasteurii]MDS9471994.1 class I SAM-dependent methyltransferase [Sporosarcina pasteurii]QBQ06722.1 class I SAM-dependent methyltransferase [Sporosarcina pasteurii]SUJ21404.1 Ribosomal RNA large subunit methyltransferase G [Sporosarcina pasteurii]
MSEHYYSREPKVKSQRQTVSTELRGETLRFTTDAGVFSKGGVDFGSRLLVESFVMPEVSGDVLDVGCGYGPIGLTIAVSYPERQIQMVDVNERAIALSKENAVENLLENVEVYSSDALLAVTESDFAAILTNPPIRAGKETVFAFYESSFSKLKVGGELWVVIQKKQGAPSSAKKLEEVFGNVTVVAKRKGYFILKAIKN